jgi:excinuclease UvrABC nuclease subunit
MIEHAHDLKFELRTSGEEALRREEELIRSVRPPYNVALNYDVSYLFIALKADHQTNKVEFRLSHMEVKEGFTTFGCFRHRGKAKAAYSALMRLLYAAFCERERFQLPSKICRSSPAYRFTTDVSPEALEHVEDYLSGRSNDLLKFLVQRLLAKDNFPKQLYLPMQRDIEILKEFYVYGPQDTAKLAKKLKLKTGLVPQAKVDQIVTKEYLAGL